MSWSFHIKNGDLNPTASAGFAVVTGKQKLLQDLRHWIESPQRHDPFHLDYGSRLDGVVSEDGTTADSFIGTSINRERLSDIEDEVRRILINYQERQIDKLRSDTILYNGLNTFSKGEILYSIDSIDVQQIQDLVLVRVQITTSDGTVETFVQPIG